MRTAARPDAARMDVDTTWLAANWADKTGTPPELPAEIVERTAARYRELLERLTS